MKKAWLDTNEYPFTPHHWDINGNRLHYIDEGEGETILFVHGTPSWSFDFRNVIKILRTRFRCIAIDHIGFGLSDKPEQYDYSTVNHSRTLEMFIAGHSLRDITLVMHDFGGPIGLNVALQHPDWIKRMVVLNSWMWSSSDDPDFTRLKLVLRSPLLPFLYRHLNFSPRFLMPGSFGDHKLSARLKLQYTKPLGSPSERKGALAFAHSLLHDQEWFESLWTKREIIQHKPLLLVWGMKDPVVKPRHLEKFLSGFLRTQVVRLDACGHFPQEEEPQAVADAMLHFVVGATT